MQILFRHVTSDGNGGRPIIVIGISRDVPLGHSKDSARSAPTFAMDMRQSHRKLLIKICVGKSPESTCASVHLSRYVLNTREYWAYAGGQESILGDCAWRLVSLQLSNRDGRLQSMWVADQLPLAAPPCA
jgi:hypothetical protein